MNQQDSNENDGFRRISSIIFPPDSRPYNLSYRNWTGKWWEWALSIPKDVNPLTDINGVFCAEGQTGPVWFLAGTNGKINSIKRSCSVPSGKAILIPVLVTELSYAEMPSIKTDKELIYEASRHIDKCSLLRASLDGIKLPELFRYRIKFGPFDLFMVLNNIWDLSSVLTRAVSDGYWIFLRPLSIGDHLLYIHGIEPHFETEVTYNLTIVP